MSAHDQIRAMLDELMGTSRDGNEKADTLAKERALQEQPDVPIMFDHKKNMIKTYKKPPPMSPNDYYLLIRNEQVIIFRLRTGHNRLHYHMHSKLKIGQSAMCTCGKAPQTTEHILQECNHFDTETKLLAH